MPSRNKFFLLEQTSLFKIYISQLREFGSNKKKACTNAKKLCGYNGKCGNTNSVYIFRISSFYIHIISLNS